MSYLHFTTATEFLALRKPSLRIMAQLRPSAPVFVLSALLCTGLSSHTARAQCTTSTPAQISWNKAIYDPKPSPDSDAEELVLPMPCGGAMVFRRVEVQPTSASTGDAAFMANRRITIGQAMDLKSTQASHSNGYNLFIHEANLAAPFTDKNQHPVYYIGKYEVTAAQYKLVMEGQGAPPPQRRNFPASNISFLEAQQFAEKWTSWLMKNAPDRLPKRGDKPGFIRLPTDAEWVFAASGGIKNSSLNTQPAPWPQPGSDCQNQIDDCIVGSSQGISTDHGVIPKPIGSLNIANPLSLYDIVGNVSEMVLTPYQMRAYLHYWNQGLTGGTQVFGGSVLNSARDISSAYRAEFAPYDDNGDAKRAPEVGFRVVIGAMTMNSLQEALKAQKGFAALVNDAANADTSKVKEEHANENDALKNLQSALSQSDQNKAELQARLTQLNQAMEAAREAQNQANAERNQADLDSAVANLTTLLTLSKQIASNRIDIVNYTAFVNDPDNARNPNLSIYKTSISTEQVSLDDTVNAYLGLLKTVSRNSQRDTRLEDAKTIIVNNLKNNYKDLPLSRRLDWLDIAIQNTKDISSGKSLDAERDIIAKIEQAAHMHYYNR
ncbi:hypothetical protein DTJ15_00015 [Parasaccharibacter sp. TMW 2.1891]|uniref:SUMF1/EgtB/PvdO family nonheme iron enzyme n=1 Tax=Acetobacteraceae TaxID=433 RepID=UPI00139C8769|nr:SUMF1/EgtB/PvdO family nonheme iron enzyme [Parasaccharibacter sp. TMW 2.1891]MCL1512598.1 hypothetical protein [Parasaccharibacter sp. TMW 2.1891]MUG78674.1 SUMF1/EgtB/PvdO family nonheme iron enzyme [Bombella sp. ESL0380]